MKRLHALILTRVLATAAAVGLAGAITTVTEARATAALLPSAGLVTHLDFRRTNFAITSEDISATAWIKTGLNAVTQSADATHPDGLTWWSVTETTAASADHRVDQNLPFSPGALVILEFDIKRQGRDTVSFGFGGAGNWAGNFPGFHINLVTGAVTNHTPSATDSTVSIVRSLGSNAWRVRCTARLTQTQSGTPSIRWWTGTNAPSTGDGTSGILLTRVKVNYNVESPYERTDAGQLVRDQSTGGRNLLPGEEFGLNTQWPRANVTTASSGGGILVTSDGVSGTHGLNNSAFPTTNLRAGVTYSLMFDLEAAPTRYALVRVTDTSNNSSAARAAFDLQTGTVVAAAGGRASITQVSPGVYRCKVWGVLNTGNGATVVSVGAYLVGSLAEAQNLTVSSGTLVGDAFRVYRGALVEGADAAYERASFPATLGGDLNATSADPTLGPRGATFDGGDDFAHLPRGVQTAATNQITVMAVATRESWATNTEMRFLSCTEAGGWFLSQHGDGLNYLVVLHAGGAYRNLTYNLSTLTPGTHVIGFTWDGRYLRGYVDGVLVATNDTGLSNAAITYHASNTILLGAESGGSAATVGAPARYFSGSMQGATIHNRALSDAEMLQAYRYWGTELAKGPDPIYLSEAFVPAAGNLPGLTAQYRLERPNLLLWTDDLANLVNSSWGSGSSGAVLTPNAGTLPSGGSATRISQGYRAQQRAVVAGTRYCTSWIAKRESGNPANLPRLYAFIDGSTSVWVSFNLDTGVVASQSSASVTGYITPLAGGFWQLEMAFTPVANVTSSMSYFDTGSNPYLIGEPMLNVGERRLPYERVTDGQRLVDSSVSKNLLVNSEFVAGATAGLPDRWIANNATGSTLTNGEWTGVATGQFGGLVDFLSAAYSTRVEAGRAYTASGQLYGQSRITVAFYDHTLAFVSGQNVSSASGTQDGVWRDVTLTFTAPATAVYARFQCIDARASGWTTIGLRKPMIEVGPLNTGYERSAYHGSLGADVATTSGDPTWGTKGVRLDGGDDHLAIPAKVFDSNEITFMGVARWENTGTSAIRLFSVAYGDTNHALDVYREGSNGGLANRVKVAGADSFQGATAHNLLPLGQTVHVAFAFNRATGAVRTWINGVLTSTATQPTGLAGRAATAAYLSMSSSGGAGFILGNVHYAQVHGRVLSDAEVMREYTRIGRELAARPDPVYLASTFLPAFPSGAVAVYELDQPNLLRSSDDFSQTTAWSKLGTATVTGTNSIGLPASGDQVNQTFNVPVAVGQVFTYSVELSGTAGETVAIELKRGDGTTYEGTQSVVALTATQTRYNVSHTFTAAHTAIAVVVQRTASTTASTVTARNAMLNVGAFALPYRATTTNQAVLDSGVTGKNLLSLASGRDLREWSVGTTITRTVDTPAPGWVRLDATGSDSNYNTLFAAGVLAAGAYTGQVEMSAPVPTQVRLYLNSTTGGGTAFTTCEVGPTPQVFTVTLSFRGTNDNLYFQIGGATSFTTGEAVFARNAMLEAGSSATSYERPVANATLGSDSTATATDGLWNGYGWVADGADDFILHGIQLYGERTLAVVAAPSTVSNNYPDWLQSGATMIHGNPGATAVFANVRRAGGGNHSLTIGSGLTPDRPVLAALTVRSGLVRGYLNGAVTASSVPSDLDMSVSASTYGAYIGKRAPSSEPFKGTFYFVVLYNRVLTDAEHAQLYRAIQARLALRGVAI